VTDHTKYPPDSAEQWRALMDKVFLKVQRVVEAHGLRPGWMTSRTIRRESDRLAMLYRLQARERGQR